MGDIFKKIFFIMRFSYPGNSKKWFLSSLGVSNQCLGPFWLILGLKKSHFWPISIKFHVFSFLRFIYTPKHYKRSCKYLESKFYPSKLVKQCQKVPKMAIFGNKSGFFHWKVLKSKLTTLEEWNWPDLCWKVPLRRGCLTWYQGWIKFCVPETKYLELILSPKTKLGNY